MPPFFSAHVYYGEMAGWISIPPGMEVGLGPGYMLDGDPAPRMQRGTVAPHFSAHFSVPQARILPITHIVE